MRIAILPAVLGASLAALAACQPQLPPPLPLPSPQDLSRCGGTAVAALIGQSLAVLPPTGPWGSLRIIRPGMAVTQDYSDTRLNIEVDDADRILRVSCG